MSKRPKSAIPSYFTDSKQFAATKHRLCWLIEGVLFADQLAVIGGAKKSLKTSLAVDLAVSLGTATPFLGHFKVPKRVKVAFISGECGEAVIKESAKRVCEARDCRLADCSVFWSFRLPELAGQLGLSQLRGDLTSLDADVVIIDPLYLCLTAGGSGTAGNLYEIGALLNAVANTCRCAGATPILIHHTTKGGGRHGHKNSDFPLPLDLDDLAYAGIGEFARQWILLSRRSPYDSKRHRDELLMNLGGNAGHSGCWSVEVDEGELTTDFGGRSWDVSVRPYSDSRTQDKSAYDMKPQYRPGKRPANRD